MGSPFSIICSIMQLPKACQDAQKREGNEGAYLNDHDQIVCAWLALSSNVAASPKSYTKVTFSECIECNWTSCRLVASRLYLLYFFTYPFNKKLVSLLNRFFLMKIRITFRLLHSLFSQYMLLLNVIL